MTTSRIAIKIALEINGKRTLKDLITHFSPENWPLIPLNHHVLGSMRPLRLQAQPALGDVDGEPSME